MPNKPATWSLESVLQLPPEGAVVLATAAVADRLGEWPFERVADVSSLNAGLDTLIAVGGGSLIDRAKAWRVFESPRTRLIAIPSLWGSGAEVSPVVVLDREGEKDIHIGQEFVPDARCLWPELADSLPESLARHGCGDVWAHALEGFLSPLANDGLREALAALIREMQTLPVANDPRWFEAGARACAGQARSSVGLVHGIAHTLEAPLRRDFPDAGWGHA
ncbi:MAG: iron-containing alcohol dehydrogenase, partial [Xanthomonadales bacterium]|nr:iron-containing alcohol dehydrogenase [Xanthomonadales bacterium]